MRQQNFYDYLGRITEVCQAAQGTAMTQIISRDTTALKNWIAAAATEQITGTVFDEKYAPLETIDNGKSVLFQKNLRSRVSYTYVKETSTSSPWDAATFYSYDILGNVDTLLQDYKTGAMANAGNRFKKIVYDFDLISGKVNQVSYQPGAPDEFYHSYEYDAENRLTEVKTSKDKIFWERDAHYEYYRHGPLARMILGQQQVQGLDYAYTLQGWLKGVNSTAVTPGSDMGGDGAAGTSNVARDVYGFSLNYFNNDHDPIGSTNPFAGVSIANDLFNGNIKAMMVNIPKLGEALTYSYKYDQLNRLTSMDVYKGLNNTTNVFTPVGINDYKESVSYDPNGNIKTYLRNGTILGGSPLAMDNLNYRYLPGTNQLDHVDDNVATTNYSIDIDDQDTLNYTYDQIGNLTKDVAEGITNISWTVYGKISSISKSDGTNIQYMYDASGNRISKIVNAKETWYIRDASGNVMSIYSKDAAINNNHLTQSEIHLYGSSRLGIYNLNYDIEFPVLNPGSMFTLTRGRKYFELSNHLGNVLVTVSDKKSGFDTNGDGVINYYVGDEVNVNDYYPGGMNMPGRRFSSNLYRYGFQNQETEKELWGGAINFNFRVEDPRLVRFFSTDPLSIKFPWNSPYAFSENRLIDGVELEGLEFVPWRGNTPGRMMVRAFAYKAVEIEDKWNNSRAGKFTNGLVNTTFGIVGTIGSVSYIAETGGTGALLGGTTALTLSLGEIGVGVTQMTDAIAGQNNGSTDFLHNSSTIPGMIAYGTHSNYAPFIDAFSALGPSFATSGGVRTFLKDGVGLKSAFSSFVESPNLLNTLGAIDQIQDVKGFVIESVQLFNSFASDKKTLRYQTLNYKFSYTVQEGDNLTTIANRLSTKVETLVHQNALSNPDKIKVGQKLIYSNQITEKIKKP